ncbi:MAG: NPCBM/NEW2 domain-containing protein [Planctomycetes bacterium]|nr:NPCBM/NEW2 domain-containing protein [Planctomycetota bacterium]
MPWTHFSLGILAVASFTASVHAGPASAGARIEWRQGAPHLDISIEAQAPPGLPEIECPLQLFDKEGKELWNTRAKIAFGKETIHRTAILIEKIAQPSEPHRIEIRLFQPDLNLSWTESLTFYPESHPVLSHSFRRIGDFPEQRMLLEVQLNRLRDPNVRNIDLSAAVRDSDENTLSSKTLKIPFAEATSSARLDFAPPDDRSVGPYRLEGMLESDALGLHIPLQHRFAFATALVPVTSLETSDPTWFLSFVDPRNVGSYTLPLPQNEKDPVSYPSMRWDAEVAHSGRQSLRIDYTQGVTAHVFSDQALPGFPIIARLWVKGNLTTDALHVHWRDRCEYALWAHQRHVNRSEAFLCRLDFEGWRSFRVPVLGDGFQAKSRYDNPRAVAVPITTMALTIHPGPVPEGQPAGPVPRSVWIDDLGVETQAPLKERVSLELATDTPDRLLHDQARLFITAGNGFHSEIRNGRIQVTARDRGGHALLEIEEAIEIGPNAFAVKEIALQKLAAQKPIGPVDLDVLLVAPGTAGFRRSGRLTLKAPSSYGLFLDFEKVQAYNGAAGGKGGVTVPGGAEGSRLALSLKVDPKGKNSAILHPALPGITDRVDLLVRAAAGPVELQPLFLDAGITGVAGLNSNAFWMPPVRVEGPDWRRIECVAPAVPPYYADSGRSFLLRPSYPLNLVLVARALGDQPGEIHVDQVRVRTHLLPEEALAAEVLYPNEMRLLPPGGPLDLQLTSFAEKETKLALSFRFEKAQGRLLKEATIDVVLPPSSRSFTRLVDSLPAGVYTLEVQGLGALPFRETLQAFDPASSFGSEPQKLLSSLLDLRKALGMDEERILLDWDNMETVPGLFHYGWFHNEAKKASAEGRYRVVPLLGFAADWAGPEAQDAIAKNAYRRYMGNNLQVPVRIADWNRFLREALREYRGKFSRWVFWQNPDMKDAPSYIPPERYAGMLHLAKHWVSFYDPQAKVVAGGFNYDKAIEYLGQIENPASLEFDELAVQMNLGELSPEQADLEGFLDELNQLLRLEETGRKLKVSELDWAVSDLVSPAEQAAYHTRACLILASRGADLHSFSLVNSGESFEGYGVFYRPRYGNSENVQALMPLYLPKPAYFALSSTRQFLQDWKFVHSVQMPDRDLQANRAFLYTRPDHPPLAVLWRTGREPRSYRIPAGWTGASARDPFGVEIPLHEEFSCTSLPAFIRMPVGYSLEQLSDDLRMLQPADGKDTVVLDLHVSDPDSCRRAQYAATGNLLPEKKIGRLPDGRRLNEVFVRGLTSETFQFQMEKPGDLILARRWMFDGKGDRLVLRLNEGIEMNWDLSRGRLPDSGPRESTFVLRHCKAGINILSVRYEEPGNAAGYRLEPLEVPDVDIARWGVLHAAQTRGEMQKFRSASGTPLAIGKTAYASGLGLHAVAFLEYPLDGLFSSFEVTVGIDAVTEGRGSASFEIHVDGQPAAKTEILNGFSKPITLKVENLEKARRLVLLVKDGGDGNTDDLADWVDGRLVLK